MFTSNHTDKKSCLNYYPVGLNILLKVNHVENVVVEVKLSKEQKNHHIAGELKSKLLMEK